LTNTFENLITYAKPSLVDIADLVTDMTMVKHPFRAGVKAHGFEF
jgi:cob(I)alamin adenosyltransferase